jgi:hypothetical protein
VRKIECEFETDVLSAVIQSRWPERVDAELREHAKHCEICSDVAAVAGAIECAREESAEYARVPEALPDSGRVWWKAQMRARREAVQAAGRPITAIQIAAFACAMVLMGACVGATSSWFQSALQWVREQMDTGKLIPYAVALVESHGLLVAAMAAMVLVIPVAVYLAVGRD